MADGSSWRIVALAFLFLAPGALAAAPFNNLSNAASPDGQSITDMAMDGTGRFTSLVVSVDASSTTVPGGTTCVPGGLIPCSTSPGTSTGSHRDVYPCDFGEPVARDETPTKDQGNGCFGIQHDAATRSATGGGVQSTAALSFLSDTDHGLVSYYAVGGPGGTAALWNFNSATHKFERIVGNGDEVAYNVSLARAGDSVRVIVGTGGTGSQLAGQLRVFDSAGAPQWNVSLTDKQGNGARSSALATAAATGATVAGVTSGSAASQSGALLFFDGAGARPTLGVADMHPLDTHAPVTSVVVARDGSAAVAGTTSGVWYVPLVSGAPDGDVSWNTQLAQGVTAVAATADGQRFAAASGSKVYFYQRSLNGVVIAETAFDPFDAQEGVGDVAYSADGLLLVAVAGNTVYGFGPGSSTPIWSFDATAAAHGALDGPLRKVAVSDTGERVVVAGRTRAMAYANVYTASAAFQTAATQIVPGQDVVIPLTVTNTGNLPDTYTIRPGPQQSASLQTNLPLRVTLNPDQSATLGVTFRAIQGTTPGDLLGDVRVASENRTRLATLPGRSALNSEVGAPKVQLTVPRAIALQVSAPQDRLLLRQAAEQSVPITIRNNGNADGVVNLTVEQLTSRGTSWVVKFTPGEQVTVPTGDSRTVTMLVSAPSDAISGERNFITLHAREGSAVDAQMNFTAYVDAQFRPDLTALNNSLEFKPGDVRTLAVNVRNAGNTDDVYNITANVTPPAFANDWRVTLSSAQVNVPVGATRPVTLTIAAAVAQPREAVIVVKAISQASPNADEQSFPINLVAKPADQPTPSSRLLPDVAPLGVVALVGLLALGRRLRGGRP